MGGSWRREDLQQWMKAKREERMAKFRKHRDNLLKSEKHPFKPTKATTRHSLKQEKLKRFENAIFIYKGLYVCISYIFVFMPHSQQHG